MICLCSDRGEKNQSSRTRQVLDAVSGLAVSLHLRPYSQRFNQVLLWARGRDLVSADHAAVTCYRNTRLNDRLQLQYKDISLIANFYSTCWTPVAQPWKSINGEKKKKNSVCRNTAHLALCLPPAKTPPSTLPRVLKEAASEGGAKNWLGVWSSTSASFVMSQSTDLCAFQHILWNIITLLFFPT